MPYNFDDDDDFLSNDDNNEIEERNKRADNHPLQLHLNELTDTLTVLLGSVETEDEIIKSQQEIIHHSLLIIKAKLHSALRSDSYLVRMQNATSIRSHGEYLRLSSQTLIETKLFKQLNH